MLRDGLAGRRRLCEATANRTAVNGGYGGVQPARRILVGARGPRFAQSSSGAFAQSSSGAIGGTPCAP